MNFLKIFLQEVLRLSLRLAPFLLLGIVLVESLAKDFFKLFLKEVLCLSLELAPFLLLGIVFAGQLMVWVPQAAILSLMGGKGLRGITKAIACAILPPLCSCSVVPVVSGLREKNVPKGPATAFLVATPPLGIDSILISWAFFGPVFTLYRIVAVIITAAITALLVEKTDDTCNPETSTRKTRISLWVLFCSLLGFILAVFTQKAVRQTAFTKCLKGIELAFTEFLDDICIPFIIGIFAAALASALYLTYKPTSLGALPPILLMLIFIVASYWLSICATDSIPFAAALMTAGASAGSILVLIVAGPAMNCMTLTQYKKSFGSKSRLVYIIGLTLCAVAAGLLLDQCYTFAPLSEGTATLSHESGYFSWIALNILLIGYLITQSLPLNSQEH